MIQELFLHKYYKEGLNPFRSMSDLSEAIPENVYMKTQSGEFYFYIETQVWDCDLLDSLNI